MVIAGGGSYSWNDIYNMPIWLRLFTYNKMKSRIEKKNNPSQSDEGTLISPDGKINKNLFAEINQNMKGKASYK